MGVQSSKRSTDLEIISACCKIVEDTKAKYGVYNDDVHNFDQTGFWMGVIGSMKVVTGTERRARLEIVQLGATGYETPPLIIYKGRPHISAYYEEADIPRD
jgi:hypothetical protein